MAYPSPFTFSVAAGVPALVNPLAADQTTVLKRQAAAPLKPRKAQAACDVGLFSDDAAQSDLVDLARRP